MDSAISSDISQPLLSQSNQNHILVDEIFSTNAMNVNEQTSNLPIASATTTGNPTVSHNPNQQQTANVYVNPNVIDAQSIEQRQSRNIVSYDEPLTGTATVQNEQGSIATTVVARSSPSLLEHIEIKLFVGRLPTSATEDSTRPLFTVFGNVIEVAIIRDKATNNHKGSAFVRMASITEADAAIRALHNTKILESSLGPLQISYATGEAERLGFTPGSVVPGEDEVKLFVGSLPRDVTEQDVESFFSKYGKTYDAYLMRDQATRKFKGCGFIKFAYKEEALIAIKQLHGIVTFPGTSRPLEVRIAEPKRSVNTLTTGKAVNIRRDQQTQRPGYVQLPSNANPRAAGPWKEYFAADGRPYYHNDQLGITQWEVPPEFLQVQSCDSGDITGPPGANIFIFHVPNEWTKEDLAAHFAPFGYILSAKVAVDIATNRNRGYGFVSYGNVRSALQAVQQMNLMPVKNKRLRVAIKNGEEEAARLYAEQNSLNIYPMATDTVPVSGSISNPITTSTTVLNHLTGAPAGYQQLRGVTGGLGAALQQTVSSGGAPGLNTVLFPTQGLGGLRTTVDFMNRANLTTGPFSPGGFVSNYTAGLNSAAATIPRYGQY